MAFWTTISLIAIVLSIGTSLHLMVNYRQPTAAVSWLFAFWTLPYLGAILYLMFAVYEGPRRIRERRSLSQKLRRLDQRKQLTQSGSKVDGSKRPRGRADLIFDRTGAIPTTHGNTVDLHPNPDTARNDILERLRNAKREIFLETYIWTRDEFTREVGDILARKFKDGVDVRVLLDAIGVRTTRGNSAARLTELGVPNAQFLAPNPLKGRFQINFRNHRKLLVIDSEVAITGGRNYGARYFDESESGIRDLSIRVQGPAVGVYRGIFKEDWFVGSWGSDHPSEDVEFPPRCGNLDLRVIPHGRDETHEVYVPILSASIREAKDDVFIVTPYFAPGPAMLHDLRVAALSGVRIRIMVPERTPERWPEIAARRFLGQALDAGVEVYVKPPPFVHAKAVVIDASTAFVGSANFDQRSFYLNYELTSQVQSADFARQVLDYFKDDLESCTQLDAEEFRRRAWWKRGIENAAALFSPII